MNKVKVVTGYVPIADHPRNADVYGKLGEQLADAVKGVVPCKAFYMLLPHTWLYKFVWETGGTITHSAGDNPAKNTLAYHCVMHQKTDWLKQAALEDLSPDWFVWIDYGIFHIPGMSAQVVRDYLDRVARSSTDQIYIPGCWPMGPIRDDYPCWRFCGGLIAVPRKFVLDFDTAFKEETKRMIWRTKNVTWEVNTLAYLEQSKKVPLRWYQADHNETMFTGL